MNERVLVCAVDVGTSAVRAAFVDAAGEIYASERSERDLSRRAGRIDPDELWQEVSSTLQRLTARHGEPVSALAVAAHVGTVLADEDQRILCAGDWGDSTGVAELADEWGDTQELLSLTGRPAVTGSAAAMLAWMHRAAPATHRRVRHVLTPKDAVVWRMTGALATDISSAGYSLLSDIGTCAWSEPLLASVGIRESALPLQHDASEVVGRVMSEAAAATGLPRGLPVVAGGPDGTVGALALIGTANDVIADVAGTTDVLLSVTGRVPAQSDGVVRNPYLRHGVWSQGGPTGFTGGAVAYWGNLLGVGRLEALSADIQTQLAAIPPGADGLLLDPYLNGSRLPNWDPTERGGIYGLTDAHTPLHVIRAAQEASAYVVRSAIEALLAGLENQQPPGAMAVLLGGGVARSPALAQLRADVLRMPVRRSLDPEATLRGAAMLASVGCGLYADLEAAHRAMSRDTPVTMPQPEAMLEYERLYRVWQAWRAGRVLAR